MMERDSEAVVSEAAADNVESLDSEKRKAMPHGQTSPQQSRITKDLEFSNELPASRKKRCG